MSGYDYVVYANIPETAKGYTRLRPGKWYIINKAGNKILKGVAKDFSTWIKLPPDTHQLIEIWKHKEKTGKAVKTRTYNKIWYRISIDK